MVLAEIRAALLPHVSGKRGASGAAFAQQWRCAPLDAFFAHFPFLGGEVHHCVLVPLLAWVGGDACALRTYVALALCFFTVNSTKDMLCLPRPKGVNQSLETTYLEEFGFPSTHTAAAVVWAAALVQVLGFSAWGQLNPGAVTAVGSIYVGVVAFSRLYVGVHSLADLFGGLQFGFGVVVLADRFLVPAMESFMADPAAGMTLPLGFTDVTLDGPLVCGLALALFLVACYPDKRPGRTSFKDTCSMVGIAAGGTVEIGRRLVAGLALPPHIAAEGLLQSGSSTGAAAGAEAVGAAAVGAVSLGSAFLLLALAQMVGTLGAVAVEAVTGHALGFPRAAKCVLMGWCIAWVSAGGVCHTAADEAAGWSIDCTRATHMWSWLVLGTSSSE